MSFSFNFQLDGDPGDGASGNSMASPELAKSEVSVAPPPGSPPPSGAESNPARLLVLDVPGSTLDESYASAEVRVAPKATSSRQMEFLVADPDRIRLPPNLAEAINGAKTGGRATDLVTGVYEGGLRVWEGSLDLVRYLDAHKDTVLFTQDHQDKKKKGAKKNKKGKSRGGGGKRSDGGNGARRLPPLRCLDLGCGHGLPGLYALRAKGSRWRVCFSDFNAEVLEHVTHPNVVMNAKGTLRFHASYVAGDWHGLKSVVTSAIANESSDAVSDLSSPELGAAVGSSDLDDASTGAVALSGSGSSDPSDGLSSGNDDNNNDDDDSDNDAEDVGNSRGTNDGLFDLILTAETCYTEKVCGEVAALLSTLLKRNRGVGLVASKRFYFGTGGGSDCFKRDAEKLGLSVTVVAIEDDGRSNIREVMEVRRPRAPPN